jgi:hypothetical protein
LIALLIGSLMVVGTMAIQLFVLLFVLKMLVRLTNALPGARSELMHQTKTLGAVILVLFLGHVLQFATWAALFVFLGEFSDYGTAFYHSTVNFTSLGYGDIVMSPQWRLLGGFEAANGVLMFGLSAGAILSMMNWMLRQDQPDFSGTGKSQG